MIWGLLTTPPAALYFTIYLYGLNSFCVGQTRVTPIPV